MVQFQKSPLVLGGGMSLTSVIEILDEVSAANANYKYTKTIADHIRKVAHPSVRNAGTIAGNLMLKHAYPGQWIFFLHDVEKLRTTTLIILFYVVISFVKKIANTFDN